MKFLKRIKFFLLVLPLFFISCADSTSNKNLDNWMQDNGKIKILSTTEMIHALVKEVGKENIDAFFLITGELDPHSYELVKGDREKIDRADLLFYNGLGLEHGASLITALQGHKNSIALGDLVYQKYPEKILLYNRAIDPHIWMDISLWAELIDPIAESLALIKPEHAKEFFHNAKLLKRKLQKAHLKILHLLQSIPKESRFLVTSHDAFNYFARIYLAEKAENADEWRKRFQAPEGLSPNGQLSSVDIQKIVDHLKLHQIPVVFSESNVSKDSIRKVVQASKGFDIDVKIADRPLFGDALMSGLEDEENYLKTMFYNAETIHQFLK